MTYDDGGRLLERTITGKIKTTYTYFDDETLNGLTNRAGAAETLLTQHTYSYDAVGNRLSHQEQVCDDNTAYAYEYDELNRLKKVKVGGVDQETYEYDPLGNRTKKATPAGTEVSLYNVANQLTEIHQGSAGGPLLSTFTYDLNGNLIERNDPTTKLTMGYDGLDQTISATATWAQPETYGYDDLGRRISKTVGSTTTNFLYDGLEIVGDYGAWSGSAQARYTHGLGLDEPVLRAPASGGAQYYHQDGLGSVVAATDGTGTTLGATRFDAWGGVVTRTGAITRYGYTGREPGLTGLTYYRARYYDPSAGRFTQPDPIGYEGGDLNLYAYVGANPANVIDPLGTATTVCDGFGNCTVTGVEPVVVFSGPSPFDITVSVTLTAPLIPLTLDPRVFTSGLAAGQYGPTVSPVRPFSFISGAVQTLGPNVPGPVGVTFQAAIDIVREDYLNLLAAGMQFLPGGKALACFIHDRWPQGQGASFRDPQTPIPRPCWP